MTPEASQEAKTPRPVACGYLDASQWAPVHTYDVGSGDDLEKSLFYEIQLVTMAVRCWEVMVFMPKAMKSLRNPVGDDPERQNWEPGNWPPFALMQGLHSSGLGLTFL